jgi:hypothetical protein
MWKSLTKEMATIPEPYRREVEKASGLPLSASKKEAPPVSLPLPLPAGIAMGGDMFEETAAKVFVKPKWEDPVKYYWGEVADPAAIIYRQSNGDEVLTMDYRVSLAVMNGISLGPVAALEKKCGKPTNTMEVTGGTLCWFGTTWAALTRDGAVKEIWIMAPEQSI